MKKRQTKMLSTAIGVAAGAGIGIAVNSAIPKGGGTNTMIANALKVVAGVYLAASKKSNAMYLAGGLGLAAEGASELISMYAGGNPEGYEGPSLFGFPGVYTSPGNYYPYRLNGVGMGAVGDAGITEQMRY